MVLIWIPLLLHPHPSDFLPRIIRWHLPFCSCCAVILWIKGISWTVKRTKKDTSESMRVMELSGPLSLWTERTWPGTTSLWWPRRLVGTHLSLHKLTLSKSSLRKSSLCLRVHGCRTCYDVIQLFFFFTCWHDSHFLLNKQILIFSNSKFCFFLGAGIKIALVMKVVDLQILQV